MAIWHVYGTIAVPAILSVWAETKEEALEIARKDCESDWEILDDGLDSAQIDRDNLTAELIVPELELVQ